MTKNNLILNKWQSYKYKLENNLLNIINKYIDEFFKDEESNIITEEIIKHLKKQAPLDKILQEELNKILNIPEIKQEKIYNYLI